MAETLTEVVEKEADKLEKAEPEKKEAEVPEVKEPEPESEEEEKPSEKESADQVLAREEATEAVKFMRALKDPATALTIVEALARQAGIIGTKAEAKAVEKTITDVVKEQLGPDYAFMADKLGPAIEAVVNEKLKGVEQKFQAQADKEIEREAENALTALSKSSNGESKQYEARMVELMDEVLPGKNISPKDYMHKLYKIARGEALESDTKKKVAEKINRNAGDAAERLSASGVSGSGHKDALPEKPTLEQAIEWAARQQSKEK